jgi:uncharacterized protein DUF3298
MKKIGLVLAAALLIGNVAVVHGAEKRALSVTTPLARITVSIDPALQRYPGLSANLLAEGRKWTQKIARDARRDRKDVPEMFSGGKRWTMERKYEPRSVVGHYVSVLRSDYANTNGAHPTSEIAAIIWDSGAKKRITISPFFSETADNGPIMTALAQLVRAAVATEKKARGITVDAATDKALAEAIKPTVSGIGSASLTPSTITGKSAGLTFHFSPYAVGPYAEGEYTVSVPWAAFKQYLSPEGTGIFEGDRPASDKKAA